MKAVKIIVIVFLVYAGIVAVFESTLGYFQPKDASNLVIATLDADGNTKERVVSRIDSGGQLYVAANHWPRRWYNDVLAHPEVQVAAGDTTQTYVAVPVTGEEFERVNADHRLGIMIRILTGFPPRRLVRLDPA